VLHLRIGGKDHGKLGGKHLGHHDNHRRHGQGQLHAGLHHLLGPVIEARSQALGAHGARAGGQGGEEELAEVADFVGHAVAGGDGDAVLVDEGEHHQPGDGGDGPLEGYRKAQLQGAFDHLRLGAEIAGQQAQIRPVAQGEHQSGQAGYRLADHGGQGRPRHPHVEPCHEQDIQHHVEAHRRNDAVQRDAGVAHPAQDGGEGIVDKDEQQAHAADAQIGGGLLQGGGLEQNQQRPSQQQNARGKEQAGDEAHGEHVARGLPTVLVVAAAEILAHQHIPTHCQPNGQLGEHIHNDAGVVDGGNSHITDVVPGDDDVRDTINSLQQAGRHQWQGIPDQLARDAALGKILFYSGHSVPPPYMRSIPRFFTRC